MTPDVCFGLALLLIYLGIFICYVTLVVYAFTHEESGWGIALLLLFWCALVPLIYGWTKVGDWEIGLLMIAFTACLVARIAVYILAIALA